MKNNRNKHGLLLVMAALFIAFVFNTAILAQAQDKLKANIEAALDEAYATFKDVKEGENASYIKELATVDPQIFGIALVTTDGQVYTKGDITSMVSIQSVSKVFTMAQVIEEQGHQAVQDKIGVDATGEVFNSITAVERMITECTTGRPGPCWLDIPLSVQAEEI